MHLGKRFVYFPFTASFKNIVEKEERIALNEDYESNIDKKNLSIQFQSCNKLEKNGAIVDNVDGQAAQFTMM